MKRTVFIIFALFYSLALSAGADLIIFSYNRPLQLYALLESLQLYATGIEQIMVIYRASDSEYKDAYGKVNADFGHVHFYCQKNAPDDFKPLTLNCLNISLSNYILFAVDDVVVKDHVDINACIEQMEKYNAYGFFLRLGKNLNYCYATYSDQQLPQFIMDAGTICVWNFAGSEWDWGYPHSLDMTLYRKADLLGLLRQLDYYSPNQLEHYLAMNADYSKKGICYQISKIINLPINLVQNYTYNNCQHSYSPQQLLDLFNQGAKMDVKALYQVNNRSSHMYDAQIQFMPR